MYGCLGGSLSLGLELQNAQFLWWSAISVYSPTRKSKKRPKTVSRSTFSWRFWQGLVLRFSRSIPPSIHPSVHTLDIYRGFRKYTLFYVCKIVFHRYLPSFLKHTWKNGGPKSRYMAMYVCMFGPESTINIDENRHTYIHTWTRNNSFLMFF